MRNHQIKKNAVTNYSFSWSLVKKALIACSLVSLLTACQTPSSSGSPSGGSSGSPLPSIPSGGSAGTPSSSDSQPPGTPPQGSESGSESSSESSSDGQAQGESGGQDGEQGEPPPGWEDDTSIADSDGESSNGEEGDVSFEESEADNSDVSFEEPDFSEDGGLTQEELEELERELNESLGDFDEDIQREKTYAEERANDSGDDDLPGGIGTFETYVEDAESGNSSSSQASSSEGGSESSSSSTAAASSESGEDAGDVSGDQTIAGQEIEGNNEEVIDLPEDIPEDISNDDIVARQIREAAENETNPELQEKLWAEYRKYKNQ